MGIGCITPAKKRKMAASILRKSPAKNGYAIHTIPADIRAPYFIS